MSPGLVAPLSATGFGRLQGLGAAAVLAVSVALVWAAIRISGARSTMTDSS